MSKVILAAFVPQSRWRPQTVEGTILDAQIQFFCHYHDIHFWQPFIPVIIAKAVE